MAHKPTGSFVALVTPMNADYSIDYAGFATLLDFQREAGTSAVLIMAPPARCPCSPPRSGMPSCARR